MANNKALLKRIEAWLTAQNARRRAKGLQPWGKRTFGVKITGDPTFVFCLERGRQITEKVEARINRFLKRGRLG